MSSNYINDFIKFATIKPAIENNLSKSFVRSSSTVVLLTIRHIFLVNWPNLRVARLCMHLHSLDFKTNINLVTYCPASQE